MKRLLLIFATALCFSVAAFAEEPEEAEEAVAEEEAAEEKNGDGISKRSPPAVTVCSCMTSNSAACVFGVARLISSTSSRW